MREYRKTILILLALYFGAVLIFALLTGRGNGELAGRDEDILKLNTIRGDAGKYWNDLTKLSEKDYGVSFVVLDTTDNLLYASDPENGKEVTISSAMKQGSLYAHVSVDGSLAGFVILQNGAVSSWQRIRLRILIGLVVFGLLLTLLAVWFGFYIQKNMVGPFRKMEEFAGYVAEGKLDQPLLMDKNNLFGAFTESFDIMREELRASRQREVELQRRERELVASLSHDLKTPVTGIKVTCELLKARLAAGTDKASDLSDFSEKVDGIYQKAGEIDALVSDLFSSAMADLDELKVSCTEESVGVLDGILRKYDDRGLVTTAQPPQVLIRVDVKRLSQVIGNIVSNSYKYANTKIEVSYRVVDEYLEMNIRDFGPGVPEDEKDLITNKFYRGKQWADSKEEGSGLGLYIAKMLMEKMDGELIATGPGEGLMITLMIPLC